MRALPGSDDDNHHDKYNNNNINDDDYGDGDPHMHMRSRCAFKRPPQNQTHELQPYSTDALIRRLMRSRPRGAASPPSLSAPAASAASAAANLESINRSSMRSNSENLTAT